MSTQQALYLLRCFAPSRSIGFGFESSTVNEVFDSCSSQPLVTPPP